MTTNVTLLAWIGSLTWIVGPAAFLTIHLPIMVLAASVGVWLFFVQHQFDETRWEHERRWKFHAAALHGSSFYDLPLVLRWFTANIGIHHVHHLSSKIPFYRLPEVLRDYPDLIKVGRITLPQSIFLPRLALWDEEGQRLISFRQATDDQQIRRKA